MTRTLIPASSLVMVLMVTLGPVTSLDLGRAGVWDSPLATDQFVQQVSCDWWTAGHVTTVLTSDWSRLPIELEVVQFSEHRGLTLASLRVNMSESHFDNDLVFETEFEKIVEKYDNYNGPDVFGRTFKRYSKSR